MTTETFGECIVQLAKPLCRHRRAGRPAGSATIACDHRRGAGAGQGKVAAESGPLGGPSPAAEGRPRRGPRRPTRTRRGRQIFMEHRETSFVFRQVSTRNDSSEPGSLRAPVLAYGKGPII